MSIELDKARRDTLLSSIKEHVSEVFEQDIGDLKASLLLDFVLREIGPAIYNKAVSDAQATMIEMIAELDGTCFESELSHE
jgi:uncharacterized protein (DUF2164 family)